MTRASSRREIYSGRVIDLGLEQVSLPDGRYVQLEIVRHSGGAVIAAVDSAHQVCLLRQYRHAAKQQVIWELPAGCIDPADSSPLFTAKRELREETGFTASNWQELGSIFTSPGFCTEELYLFLARGLTESHAEHEQDELIEVHWVPLVEALAMAQDRLIQDAKTIVGLMRAVWFMEQIGN
jgi:ADP-ribose diphosphatase